MPLNIENAHFLKLISKMKKSILVLSLILLIGCKSKPVDTKPLEIIPVYLKLTISEVSENQKKKAYDLGKRILNICNTSKFIPFNESEATQSVIQNTTIEKHSKICLRFREKHGSFKDIKLIEIYKNSTGNALIFRYKAFFERENANKELRVTLNNENKVSSLKTMEWTDSFKYK